ncbi:MAG: DUF3280 domain-containing protein [Proteobacteria bacterium]|nr:DUF3280 domain-containing protein [Pseudomonadota bacterium]
MSEARQAKLPFMGRMVLLVALCGAWPVGAEPPSLTVAPFDLIEEHPDPSRAEDQQRRLEAVRSQFIDEIQAHGLYRVVAPESARDVLDRLRARHAFLYDCPQCKSELGEAAGVKLVAVGWVQKVSNLILNINVEVSDATSGRVLAVQSVDIRGNTDQSWMRGMRFLVRKLAERQQPAAGPGD